MNPDLARMYSGHSRPLYLLALFAAGATLLSVANASAGLMNSTFDVRLTGPVLAGGHESVEQYEGLNIQFDGSGESGNGDPLVNTISPTPVSGSAFQSTTNRVPRIFEPSDGGASGINVDIWIKGPTGDPNNVFLNPLNTSDPTKFVELELWLKWDDLPFGEQIDVTEAHLIKGINPAAKSIDFSGIGSVSDPLYLRMKFDPADVASGGFNFVKVWFDYETTVIPEPTSLALIGLGGIGLVGSARRRRK